jgi:alpha-tubulin suppressor-like RCC1 family protein
MNPPVQGSHPQGRQLRPEDAARLRRISRRYELLRELGRGGMAVVYLARDRELGREVAVKVIHAQHAADAETVSRMEREARTVARLDHSCIVTLYESRHLADGSLALVMQYVPGGTLKEAIRRDGPFDFDRAEHVLRDLAEALAYAHGRRIVHRDVKPGNVYLDEETGRALLADFGIARWADAEELTMEGTALGTPTYMSPEQIDGLPVDGRSDLYSLGLVGYEMVTGRRPWEGATLYATIYNHKNEAIPPLEELRPGVPPRLAVAIEGALRKDREARWAGAEELLAYLAGTGPAPRPLPAPPRAAAAAPLADEWDPTIIYRRDDAEEALAGPVPAAAPLPVSAPEPEPAPRRRWRSRRLAAAAGVGALLLAGAVGAAAALRDDAPPPRTAARPAVMAPQAAVRPAAAPPTVAAAPVPARLAALADGELQGRVGEALAGPVAVRVEDAGGAPVPGVEVSFAAEGGGAVTPAAARTDSLGVARVSWKLGGAAAEQTLAARIAGVAEPLLLRARGVAGAPARIAAASGDAQEGAAGKALADSLAVRVEDAFGNPVAGVRVRFRAARDGGRVAPEWARTDSTGRAAAAWTLGPGERATAEAAAEGAPALRVRFAARAAAPPQPAALAAPAGKITAGGMHTCALGASGEAYCWGGNDRGQLGTGENERRATPTRVGGGVGFASLSGGVLHTCALTGGGAAYCWGANDAGQLGDGSARPRTGPVRVAGRRAYSSLGAGNTHTCGLADGAVYCWGANRRGQVGDGSTVARSTPAKVAGSGFRRLAVGWDHACALDERGRAMCWGAGTRGQLGDGGRTDRSSPVEAEVEGRLVALAAGSAHTCALTGDGEAWCWGSNNRGQLGDGSTTDRARPVAVRGGERFGAITAGGGHACALAGDGEAWCWGRNDRGQLGDGTNTDRTAPVPVSGGLRFASLHASGAHTCGVTVSGRSFCWGYNLEGQLGDGTRTHRSRPVAVARPSRE